MATPTGKTDIANLALDALRERPIADIENPSNDRAALCSRHYDKCRRSVFRKYSPNSCKATTTISRENGVSGDSEFADKYILPADFIRLQTVEHQQQRWPKRKYALRGRELFVNAAGAATITIFYIKDETDISVWDPILVDVVALTLALSIAYATSAKKDVVERIDRELTKELSDLMSINGQEFPPIRVDRSRLLEGRRRLSSGSQFTTGNRIDFRDW